MKSLMIALKDKDPMIRSHAALALGAKKNIGKYSCKVNKALIQTLLEDKEATVRYCAVGALVLVNDKHVIDALIYSLNDENEEVRSVTFLALAGLDDEYVFESLITALNAGDANIRKRVASVFGYKRDKRAVEQANMNDESTD